MNIEGLWKYDKLIKVYEAEVQHNMELEKDYDNLLEELEEYKEKIITARQELEDLKKHGTSGTQRAASGCRNQAPCSRFKAT